MRGNLIIQVEKLLGVVSHVAVNEIKIRCLIQKYAA